MWQILLTAVVLLLAMYISMSVRVSRIKSLRSRTSSVEEQDSPLAQAIKDFVAIAGGVYLALNTLAEFLKVPVPIQSEVLGTTFDPVALFAVCLAIIAPMFPSRKERL
jgi:Na+/H+ antiporter NhaD/arsenite permease-like protein